MTSVPTIPPDDRLDLVTSADGTGLFMVTAGPAARSGILFVHGACTASAAFAPLFDGPLAESFRLVRFDLRGHGLSDKPAAPSAYTESVRWAQDVDAVVQASGLERVILCAWSFGGLVACDYLRHCGVGALAGLVLVDAPTELGTELGLGFYGNALDDAFPALLGGTSDEHLGSMKTLASTLQQAPLSEHEFYAHLGYSSAVPQHVARALGARTAANGDVLAGLTLPTLVFHGAHDQQIRLASGEHVRRTVPGAELVVMADSAHMPFVEQQEEFESRLAAFATRVLG